MYSWEYCFESLGFVPFLVLTVQALSAFYVYRSLMKVSVGAK